MQVKVEGIQSVAQVLQQLEALPGVLEEVALEDGLLAAAKVVAAEAKQTADFSDHTGNLRRSIRARRGTRRYRPSALVETKRPEGAHAHLIEFGTVKMQDKPFLVPAANNTKAEQLRACSQGVRKNFSKVERELKGKIKVSRRTARALAE